MISGGNVKIGGQKSVFCKLKLLWYRAATNNLV
jgi:hypothetical protein